MSPSERNICPNPRGPPARCTRTGRHRYRSTTSFGGVHRLVGAHRDREGVRADHRCRHEPPFWPDEGARGWAVSASAHMKGVNNERRVKHVRGHAATRAWRGPGAARRHGRRLHLMHSETLPRGAWLEVPEDVRRSPTCGVIFA